MPVRNAVSAAEIIMPPTFARFSGRAARVIAAARCGQTPHFEEIAAGHIAGGRIARDEARDFSSHLLPGARVDKFSRLEEEGHVPDVVEAERNQRALHDTVDGERQRGLPMHRPIREGLDRVADGRPDKAQDHPCDDNREGRDDRHRALAREKAKIGGKLNLIKSVENRGRDEARR